MLNEAGPDHEKIFTTQYSIEWPQKEPKGNLSYSAIGIGKTKKDSEMKAAQKLLEKIKNHPLD